MVVDTKRSEHGTAAALVVLSAFQAALAGGAPWGRAAYGGTRNGVLPRHLRVVSLFASTVYGIGAVGIIRGGGSARVRQRGFTGLSVFMSLGVLANGASRSSVERAIWTPFTAATAVLAWRARPERA